MVAQLLSRIPEVVALHLLAVRVVIRTQAAFWDVAKVLNERVIIDELIKLSRNLK